MTIASQSTSLETERWRGISIDALSEDLQRTLHYVRWFTERMTVLTEVEKQEFLVYVEGQVVEHLGMVRS